MSIDQALQHAVTRHQAGFLAEAETIYRLIIAVRADYPDPYYLLSEIRYRMGHLSEAKELIDRAIALRPEPAPYYNLLGAILLGLKRYEEAAASLHRAIALDPAQTLAYCNLGNLLRELRRFDEAIEAYQRALALEPGSFTARHGLGLVFLNAIRLAEASESFRLAVRIDPRSAEAHYNLGTTLAQMEDYRAAEPALRAAIQLKPSLVPAHRLLPAVLGRLGRFQDAIDALRDAARLIPDDPVVWNDLGVALTDLLPESATELRYDEAIACCQRALALKPNFFEAHNNLGNALSGRKHWEEAIASYHRALALNHGYPQTHINLGTAYFESRRYEESIACCRRALALDPDSVEAHQNLGSSFLKQWRWDDAIASLQRAVTLKPDYPDAYSHLGIAYCEKGDFDQALHFHRRAIACGPSAKNAHYNLGMFLLQLGQYEEGLREYEYRLPCSAKPRQFSKPRWNGERVEGETILLHAEQGFGDTIHFLRYVKLVCERARAKRVILECQRDLGPLLAQTATEEIQVIEQDDGPGAEIAPFDRHLPLLSAPLSLRIFEPLPMSSPYLHADPELRALWRDRLRPSAGPRIGLAWQGNPAYERDRFRSIPPERFLPLMKIEGAAFYSLQVKSGGVDATALMEAGLIDLTEHVRNFSDTAALVAELDLVVTIETSVAPLAGALGQPIWNLLSFAPYWLWGFKGEKTPWYPTMRLFRQPKEGDWDSVLQRVGEELAEWVANRRPKAAH